RDSRLAGLLVRAILNPITAIAAIMTYLMGGPRCEMMCRIEEMGYLQCAWMIVRIRDELADNLATGANHPCSLDGIGQRVALSVADDGAVHVNLVDKAVWDAAR